MSEQEKEDWYSHGLQEKLDMIETAEQLEEETTTRKFYRWVFSSLLLTGIVYLGVTL